MNNITFNRSTNIVTGLNRSPLPYEFQVLTPFPITLSKSIQESTNQQIQKTNSENQPLFKDNIQTDEQGIEIFDEVTKPTKVISTQMVTNEYKIATDQYTSETIINELGEEEEIQIPIYTTISTSSEIPLETIELEPVLVEEFITKTYNLENGYMNFDYYEVLEAKKISINNNSLTNLFFMDEDFLGNDLILSNCSIGDGILIIHPQGSVSTPILSLTKSTNIIEIYQESQNAGLIFYINNVEVTNSRVKLPTQVNQITIKVSNPTSKNLELYCLGGLI